MDTKKVAMNALLVGCVGALATNLILGRYGDVDYYGFTMPAYLATGAGCAVGSVVSDFTSEMVIKRMGANNQIMNGSTLAVQVGIGGVASSAVLFAGGLPSTDLPRAFIIGAGSKLGGDYANAKLFDPRTGFIPF